LFHVEHFMKNTHENKIELLKRVALDLPELPGVYRFYDKEQEIIYVGKAKRLKQRVSSYFNKTQDRTKVVIMVRQIESIQFTVVETETDALLLENNLIKKHQPRYNVMLKDDKSYPWICIKNEPFPRVFQTRNVIKDGSKYYGPYTSIYLVRVLMELFKKLFTLRTCKFALTESNISQAKFQVCLEYHIKNCNAPCIGLQSEVDYALQISQIENILNGHFVSVKAYLTKMMNEYAANLNFENAQIVKDKLAVLENYQSKSTVVSPTVTNVDVFSITSDDDFAYVNMLKIVDGAIIQVHTAEFKKRLDETEAEVLPIAMTEIIKNRMNSYTAASEFVVPFEVDFLYEKVKITVPKIGDKKKLLELSQKNVKYFMLEKHKERSLVDPDRHKKRILETMKTDLHLSELPVHIECFDNSNIQGTNPVAACVVFKDAKPSKKDYRKFNIKTVVGPDDFASMREIIHRRYKRLSEENESLPQLIIIDGGKGQLSAAVESLKELGLYGKIAIIGIAKRLEEIFFPSDSIPLYLDKNSETLKVIQQARNEAHRFGITFHRDKRSKNFIVSELEQIEGLGQKSIDKLLGEFKTIRAISETSADDLTKVVGAARAAKILAFFGKNHTD